MRRGRRLAAASALALGSLTLAGCATGAENGGLASRPGVTEHTETTINLWNGAWIAALAVGAIVWGMILWAVAFHRKRKDDEKLPVQTRVHLPLELMYTIVPIIMIVVLFKWTAQTAWEIKDVSEPADLHVQAIGKQWSWDFNYLDDDVYFPGVQAHLTGEEGVVETLPTLYLPVDETVEITVDSRDVVHSFWIPAFLFKIDAIPGRTNVFQVTPQELGDYHGKCAELCGEFHASMLFNVKVVERDEYEDHMEWLRDQGYEGEIGLEYSRRATEQEVE